MYVCVYIYIYICADPSLEGAKLKTNCKLVYLGSVIAECEKQTLSCLTSRHVQVWDLLVSPTSSQVGILANTSTSPGWLGWIIAKSSRLRVPASA